MTATWQGYSVVIEDTVRWGDMDAFQHVNNTVYFQYFESARIAYFERAEILATHPIGPILGATSCRFKAPLSYPDQLQLGARVSSFTDDRFTMAYAVFSADKQRVVAEGDGVVVGYNYQTQQKAPLPAGWVSAIRRLDGL